LNSIHCSTIASIGESAMNGRSCRYTGARHGSRLSFVLRRPALTSA
jgi:hypothetical protein